MVRNHMTKRFSGPVLVEKLKWIGVLVFLMAVIYGSHKLSLAVAADLSQDQKTVVIDPGHGSDDPGKIGVNGALEKDINLAICKEIKKELEDSGVEVVLTREKDEMLADGKTEDLKERVNIINKTKSFLAVSVHQNSFTSEKESGAQVFYCDGSEEGEKLALILQEQLKKLDEENRREAKANNTYYLLKRTEVPTVIVECGFLSNWEEAEKLTEETYQKEVAKAISKGILQFLEDSGEE